MKRRKKEKEAEDALFIQDFEERLDIVRTLTDRIQREQARYNQLTKIKQLLTLKKEI